MKAQAQFRNFLLSGKLGPIETGVKQEVVHNLLGSPDDVSAVGFPAIWKYGSLQLGFVSHKRRGHSPRLNFIGLYYSDAPFHIPIQMADDDWWPAVGTDFDEFTQFVRRHDIPFHEDPLLTCEDQLTLSVGIGVKVAFDVQGSSHVLDSAQLYSTKQLTNA